MLQTIGKLVRMTIEGQVPPFLIALIFMVEFSKSLPNIQQRDWQS
jgi:hypothetical protein